MAMQVLAPSSLPAGWKKNHETTIASCCISEEWDLSPDYNFSMILIHLESNRGSYVYEEDLHLWKRYGRASLHFLSPL